MITTFKWFTIADILLIVFLFLLTIVLFFQKSLDAVEGQFVHVFYNGEEQQTLALDKEATIHIEGAMGQTTVKIGEGKTWILSSPCPHKICEKMGKIHRVGDVLVCVPNRISVRITGQDDISLDGVTM